MIPNFFYLDECTLMQTLISLLFSIWIGEPVPLTQDESLILFVFMMKLCYVCDDHCGISLILIGAKVLATLLLRRLTPIRK